MSDPNTNIWSFYNLLEVHLLIVNGTLIISIVLPFVDNIFHLQLYQLRNAPVVNSLLNKILTIHVANPYLDTTVDGQYFVQPVYMNIMKCCV